MPPDGELSWGRADLHLHTTASDGLVSPRDLVDFIEHHTVLDLIELEKQGFSAEPMRKLFRENRVVSSIAAELDQKACWEIFTDRVIAQKYFSAEERQVFRRHILWTRILSARNSTFPDGESGDLLDYVRQERETLVLKPNRAYGGSGVVIGPLVEQAAWEAAIDKALADQERSVVQQLASIPVSVFPVLGPDGKIHFEPFYTVMGFAPSKYGVAILARELARLWADVEALLKLNRFQKDGEPPLTEVVVMSRNSPETGLRVLNNIRSRKLPITRFAFTAGEPRGTKHGRLHCKPCTNS